MNIQEKRINNIAIVLVEGNIALTSSIELRNFVKPIVENNDVSDLLMNFEKVSTIDSSGVGVIVQIYKSLSENKKRLIITNLNEKCYDVFLLTRLNKILTIIKTESEGLDLLK
ncbi:MAG: STAS domain-containing protein [Deltaproteobacteria bacterium]|nr:STAS domain-containing protein [Deltaproteobacteria bacterium]MBT4527787.1 STAS domain-containing protein [Deltaproteobacteria bacterium]